MKISGCFLFFSSNRVIFSTFVGEYKNAAIAEKKRGKSRNPHYLVRKKEQGNCVILEGPMVLGGDLSGEGCSKHFLELL